MSFIINPFRFAVGGGVSARYWRVFITTNNGDANYTVVSRVEMYSSALNGGGRADVTQGKTLIFSTQGGFGNDPNQYASKAFDDDNATYWTTANPPDSNRINSWIGCDFGTDIAIDRFALQHSVLGVVFMPKDFSLQYSSDNVNWTTLFTPPSQTGWTVHEMRLFTAPSYSPSYSGSPHGAHRYWRIHVELTQAGTQAATVAEVEFRATPGGADQCSGGTASASSSFNGSTLPANAFDNNNTTLWAASGGGNNTWLAYDFGSGNAVSVAEVLIRARNDSFFNQIPKDGQIEFSDDGTNWSVAWEYSLAAVTAAGQERTTTDPEYV